ncbi:hypothetical protein TWF103_000656 [Orbilia oligospora]|nr:hypothetical protein TWF103_000656 [Orbilia oligospora]
MFRNPVVVKGYPIPWRLNLKTGLEIPLKMMAGLARSHYIQAFDGHIFIKGFSTLLIPTKRDDNITTWHLLYNRHGNRISYLENTISHADGLNISELRTSQHILGWCPEADYYAGAADADYKIRPSHLSRTYERCLLYRAHISKARDIQDGASFALGRKDTPFHMSGNISERKIRHIHTNPDEPFGKCECKGEGKSERHSHFAHTLLPSKLFRIQAIFEDLGHPEANAPLTSPESEALSNDVDSGLGTILSQSSFFDPRTKLGTGPSFTDSKSRSERRLTSAQTSDGIAIVQTRLVFKREDYNWNYGTCAAADVLVHMKKSFPNLKICLLVGIGGGVPSEKNDIQLGDVVVSHPEGDSTGVIQYDLGKTLKNNEFVRKGFLQSPPRFIMTGISDLESDPDKARYPLQACLEGIATRHPEYGYPGYQFGPLLAANAKRNSSSSGDGHKEEGIPGKNAQVSKLQPRTHPKVHYGLIASGNQVIKSEQVRDKLASQYSILCFEMEAAGIMNACSCLVIRGICDYSDSQKNHIWQEYAAATAAAYAKLLLSYARVPKNS